MSGLFNAIFGENDKSDAVLALLGLTKGDTGRFRDAYVKDGEICIYTRNGGGNRDDYQGTFDELSKHPNWLRDEDDDFDCTYATIYFSIPEEHKELVSQLDDGTPTPSEKWKLLFEALEKKA